MAWVVMYIYLFFQGHTKPIHSVCWDPSGELLASVSEDSVRVWTLGSGSEGKCVHQLSSNGNKFHSCVFHPTYSSLLVIGCYQASYRMFSFDFVSLYASSSSSSSNLFVAVSGAVEHEREQDDDHSST